MVYCSTDWEWKYGSSVSLNIYCICTFDGWHLCQNSLHHRCRSSYHLTLRVHSTLVKENWNMESINFGFICTIQCFLEAISYVLWLKCLSHLKNTHMHIDYYTHTHVHSHTHGHKHTQSKVSSCRQDGYADPVITLGCLGTNQVLRASAGKSTWGGLITCMWNFTTPKVMV